MNTSPLRILFVLTELAPGGAERVVYDLACELKQRGHHIALAVLARIDENTSTTREFRQTGMEIFSLNLTRFTPYRLFNLRKIIRQFHPDVVHAHLFHPNIISRLNGFGRKYLLVNTIHIMEIRKNQFWRFWLDRLTFPFADAHTAVSHAARDFHAAKLGIQPEKIHTILNGIHIPPPTPPPRKTQLLQQWNISHCNKIIGSIGRLNPQKGFDRLFPLLPALSQQIPDGQTWALVLIGEGPQRQHLESLAANTPPKIKVVLPGFYPDAASLISIFDLFLMPSRSEGFSLALLEAMSHGLPILTQNIPCLNEAINLYQNGQTIDFTAPPNQIIPEIIALSNQKNKIPFQKLSIQKMADAYLALFAGKTGEKEAPRLP